jgi:hypothetical protein
MLETSLRRALRADDMKLHFRRKQDGARPPDTDALFGDVHAPLRESSFVADGNGQPMIGAIGRGEWQECREFFSKSDDPGKSGQRTECATGYADVGQRQLSRRPIRLSDGAPLRGRMITQLTTAVWLLPWPKNEGDRREILTGSGDG